MYTAPGTNDVVEVRRICPAWNETQMFTLPFEFGTGGLFHRRFTITGSCELRHAGLSSQGSPFFQRKELQEGRGWMPDGQTASAVAQSESSFYRREYEKDDVWPNQIDQRSQSKPSLAIQTKNEER